MSDIKTNIINLYGGPGAGKSTSAAYLYYLMKAAGENVELVREYVKDWAWEGRKINTYDQIYFLGKQVRKESMLFGKVKWIITDSPIFMNLYYASHYCTPTLSLGVKAATLAFYQQSAEDGHRHFHILLRRNKPYLSEGRYQTEDEAIQIDRGVEKMLQEHNVSIIHSTPDEDDLLRAFHEIKGQTI